MAQTHTCQGNDWNGAHGMGKQWVSEQHSDTHWGLLSLLWCHSSSSSSEISVMLINQYSDAKSTTKSIARSHISSLAHTLAHFCNFVSGDSSSPAFFCHLSPSCSLLRRKWASHSPHITLLAVTSLEHYSVFFFPSLASAHPLFLLAVLIYWLFLNPVVIWFFPPTLTGCVTAS